MASFSHVLFFYGTLLSFSNYRKHWNLLLNGGGVVNLKMMHFNLRILEITEMEITRGSQGIFFLCQSRRQVPCSGQFFLPACQGCLPLFVLCNTAQAVCFDSWSRGWAAAAALLLLLCFCVHGPEPGLLPSSCWRVRKDGARGEEHCVGWSWYVCFFVLLRVYVWRKKWLKHPFC